MNWAQPVIAHPICEVPSWLRKKRQLRRNRAHGIQRKRNTRRPSSGSLRMRAKEEFLSLYRAWLEEQF